MLTAIAVLTLMTGLSAAGFLLPGWIRPGRKLPCPKGWYTRALAINLLQLGITLVWGRMW